MLEIKADVVHNHDQICQTSCIPSAIEFVLKLLGKVNLDYNVLQRDYMNKSAPEQERSNFKQYEVTINGVKFYQKYTDNVIRNDRKTKPFSDNVFKDIDDQLQRGKYVIAAIMAKEGNWHNIVIYGEEAGDYLAFDPAIKQDISNVKKIIENMGGTDILMYDEL